MARHSIRGNGTTAVVDTDGGRLASLQIDGKEVLVTEGEKPTRWGAFPMVPWCGRLDQGRLRWFDELFQYPITTAPHANHGFVHTQPWRVANLGPTVINLVTELNDPWTFGGQVRQRFELTEQSLTVDLRIEATSYMMPAMLGWHPWFRRQLETGESAILSAEPGKQYKVDETLIPTGQLIAPEPQPWDACFTGLRRPPSISWEGAVELRVSSSFDYWVFYTEPQHALCVEPQSGPPNQLNLQPHILQPGQRLSGWMAYHWNVPPTSRRH